MRSFYYLSFLCFFGLGCGVSSLKPTDILFDSKLFQGLTSQGEKFEPGDLACWDDHGYVYLKALTVCNCRVRNAENDWLCRGFPGSNCHLTSPSCFCWLQLTPEHQAESESELKSVLLYDLPCDPGEDIAEWRKETMECFQEKEFFFWLRHPESDGQCQKEKKEGKNGKE